MDNIELLAESIIELEDIKHEQEESVTMTVWNSTELKTNTLKSEVKEEEEDDDDEVLEPPVAIFLEEVAHEEEELVDAGDEEGELLLYEQDLHVGSERKDRNCGSLGGVPASLNSPTTQSACNCTSDGKADNQTLMKLGAKLLEHRPCKKCSTKQNTNIPTQKHSSGVFECSECQESFAQSDRLAAHKWIHWWGKTHNCPLCQMSFKRSQNFVLHMREHSGEEPYKCLICEKTFRGRGPLVLHMRTHTEEKSHFCFVCKESFERRDDFDRHVQVHAQDTSQSHYLRPIYPKSVFEPTKILVTLTPTHPEETYHCSVCQKSFKRREQLVNHMLLHSGSRRHPCSVCKMRFTRREHLERHMRVHTGERPHCCSICQKSFIQSDNLVKHMRIHSGERPHACFVCDKRFAQRSVLVTHMQTHIRETISCHSKPRVSQVVNL
ncbi:hypothetical protein R5R35_002381 [Gryllus longicercus]|uniref:C2H2-type domain-containing protein n=1 Tax=Gryllus longicercus TaxID=2509291 RepID=A0AAN9YY79_9ORTH